MWPFSALGSQDNLFYFSATSVKVKRNKKVFILTEKLFRGTVQEKEWEKLGERKKIRERDRIKTAERTETKIERQKRTDTEIKWRTNRDKVKREKERIKEKIEKFNGKQFLLGDVKRQKFVFVNWNN